MKRILVITWFYPPVNSSEAQLTAKLLKSSGYSYDIFTQGRSEAWSYGRDAELPDFGNQRSIVAASGELKSWVDEADQAALSVCQMDRVLRRPDPLESL